MYSATVQKLIEVFSSFPTVGPRTAARFVFYLMDKSSQEIEEILKSISELKKVKACPACFKRHESEQEICRICSDPRRDKTVLCVVSSETDLEAIEKTGKYKGLYFVLGGTVSRLKKESLDKLRTKGLEDKLKNSPGIKEVIIATNLTPEGESTALYLERSLKPLNKKITRLGRGLPIGGELEYADEETLSSALEARR